MSLETETEKRLSRAYQERDESNGLIRAGVMSLLDAKTQTELQVIAIYGSVGFPSISLDATTEGNVLEMADAIERQVPNYNEFRGKDVASVIRSLHEKGLIMRLAFGREGSPVVYVEPPFWTDQASNIDRTQRGESRQYSRDERKAMFKQIRSALFSAQPDELGYSESIRAGSYEIAEPTEKTQYVRAWWD